MTPETHAVIRTAALVVAAAALVAIALFTYQGAQADREAACWAEINALWGGDRPYSPYSLVDRCRAL